MRKLLLLLLRKPLVWLNDFLSEAPKKENVFRSLEDLYNSNNSILNRLKTIDFNPDAARYIIFSDQHKGNKSFADDFATNERNYIAALAFYNSQDFHFINLGDSEELWKFGIAEILKNNEPALAAEAAFFPDRYYKTFGNHDIIWKDPVAVALYLKKYFGIKLPVYEGIILKSTNSQLPLQIFLTHGHQGDVMSDNNAISTWIIAHIWMPLQRYLRMNINVPSKDYTLRNAHNKLMYEWSSGRENLVLVTGHTHKPVFASGKYLDHPSNKIETKSEGENLIPSYFNTGCCCYADGDITGIEIADGKIRLIKWYNEEVKPERIVLEEVSFEQLVADLKEKNPDFLSQ